MMEPPTAIGSSGSCTPVPPKKRLSRHYSSSSTLTTEEDEGTTRGSVATVLTGGVGSSMILPGKKRWLKYVNDEPSPPPKKKVTLSDYRNRQRNAETPESGSHLGELTIDRLLQRKQGLQRALVDMEERKMHHQVEEEKVEEVEGEPVTSDKSKHSRHDKSHRHHRRDRHRHNPEMRKQLKEIYSSFKHQEEKLRRREEEKARRLAGSETSTVPRMPPVAVVRPTTARQESGGPLLNSAMDTLRQIQEQLTRQLEAVKGGGKSSTTSQTVQKSLPVDTDPPVPFASSSTTKAAKF